MKTYKFSNGIEIRPILRPCGVFYSMGETQVAECRVFVVFQNGKEMAIAETWQQAKDFVFSLLTYTP